MNPPATDPKRAAPAARMPDSLLAHWPGVYFRQRPDFSFEFVSDGIEELTGAAPSAWQSQPKLFWQVVHELDADELRQQIKRLPPPPDGATLTYRVRNLRTGRIAYISEFRRARTERGDALAGYEGFWQDVTRQTIAEMRLAAAAWKETLAVITMGLAHDFNNVMAGIISLSESFLSQVDAAHPFHEGLGLINQNGRHASQLIHRLLHLHHGKMGDCNYHDLNEITADTVELLRQVIPRRIEVTTQLAPAPLPLYVDAVEFRQVIINLALNAADAMPDRGKLRFQTAAQHERPVPAHFHGALPRPPGASLTVTDDGCGIKPHQLASIFDPFFTTKPMNKGSGLGLYNARLFAEKHHGAISVESAEGAGATFGVWLPQADFTEADAAREHPGGRRRCVLLAGQAGKSLDATAEFLRLHNYQVVTTTEAPEARLETGGDGFDAIIVQVEARETGTPALVAFVRRQKLPLKIILQIVGCNQDELETQFLQRADLILTADMAEEVILKKLDATLDVARGGGS